MNDIDIFIHKLDNCLMKDYKFLLDNNNGENIYKYYIKPYEELIKELNFLKIIINKNKKDVYEYFENVLGILNIKENELSNCLINDSQICNNRVNIYHILINDSIDFIQNGGIKNE